MLEYMPTVSLNSLLKTLEATKFAVGIDMYDEEFRHNHTREIDKHIFAIEQELKNRTNAVRLGKARGDIR